MTPLMPCDQSLWTVEEEEERGCLECHQPIGEEHQPYCPHVAERDPLEISDFPDLILVNANQAANPSNCYSCGEVNEEEKCPNSTRDCGHHCNCSWVHDKCHWCGKEWGAS